MHGEQLIQLGTIVCSSCCPAVLLACLGAPWAQQRWNHQLLFSAPWQKIVTLHLCCPALLSKPPPAPTHSTPPWMTRMPQPEEWWMLPSRHAGQWKILCFQLQQIMNVQIKDLDFCISIGLQNHLLSYLDSDNQVLEQPDMIYSHLLLAWNAFQLLFKLTGVLGHWWASSADWADALAKISLYFAFPFCNTNQKALEAGGGFKMDYCSVLPPETIKS